jgi:hypothetical protein
MILNGTVPSSLASKHHYLLATGRLCFGQEARVSDPITWYLRNKDTRRNGSASYGELHTKIQR